MTTDLHDKRSRAGKKGAHGKYRIDQRPENLRTTRNIADLRRGRNEWYAFKNVSKESAELDIYGEIGYFGITAQDFIAELRTIDSAEIKVNINSPGGDAFDGTAIYTALLKHPATINVDIDGWAASAASFIAMAGDHIRIGRSAQMMIHDAWGLAIGNAEDMRKLAEELDGISDGIADVYAERTGFPKEYWRERMRDESWFRGQEAIDAGLADELITRRGQDDDDEKPDSTFDLSVFRFAGRDAAPEPVMPPEPSETETPGAPIVVVEPEPETATAQVEQTVEAVEKKPSISPADVRRTLREAFAKAH